MTTTRKQAARLLLTDARAKLVEAQGLVHAAVRVLDTGEYPASRAYWVARDARSDLDTLLERGMDVDYIMDDS